MRTVYAQKNKKIILGRQGEDKAVRVVWPGIVSDWSSLYGDGSFQLSVRRFGDENAYPVVVEVNGDDVIFTVTSAETAIAGNGKCELTYIANGTIAKSATWETVVLNSLTGQEPSEPPEEPAMSWFTAIQGQIGDLNNLETTSKDNLVAAINEAAKSGGGISTTEKTMLLSLFKNAAYTADMSATIAQLETLWSGTEEPDEPVTPDVTLSSISATYSGGSVPVGTAASSLTGVNVTAHYSDGSTATVTGYTLSGTIVEGSNTITVSYGGKTTTFTVTGVADESGGNTEVSGNEDVVVTGATATDDGNGNVTVTGLTATDDSNGNITVS